MRAPIGRGGHTLCNTTTTRYCNTLKYTAIYSKQDAVPQLHHSCSATKPQCTTTLHHTVTYTQTWLPFSTLQHTATHCNTPQHTATHCTALQHTEPHHNTWNHTAPHCTTLRHTAPHCITLHHKTLCWNIGVAAVYDMWVVSHWQNGGRHRRFDMRDLPCRHVCVCVCVFVCVCMCVCVWMCVCIMCNPKI